ncbi:ABC transporter substrate-binding protein (plasmid) [Mesorhizobium sp. ORM8.1]
MANPHRRTFLKLAASASAASLLRPSLSEAQQESTLRYIAVSDLAYLDPVTSTAFSTRNHAFMVYDTLFAVNSRFEAVPQMLASHKMSEDELTWTLTLRDGLAWHDGQPVTARDCVASIKRWAQRDQFGAALIEATRDLADNGPATIVFSLKKPFPLLADALGKPNSPICVMMPERLAKTDPNQAVTEAVGSGPFRYAVEKRVPGVLNVYEKFDKYVPRRDGVPDFVSGPKIAHFDEVRWTTMTDIATSTAALQNGEQDWLEIVNPDARPLLQQTPGVEATVLDNLGEMTMLQVNHLQPPFNNPAIRRAFWGAIDQDSLMQAVVGSDKSLYQTPVGFFSPNGPMANDAGMDRIRTPKSRDQVKKDLIDAGYKGEKVVFIVASENPTYNSLSAALADTMTRVGINVEYVALDLATLFSRRKNTDSVDRGGWSAFVVGWAGSDWLNPAVHVALRSSGANAYAGWANIPKIVELRKKWFEAPDVAAQKAICEEMQAVAFEEVPFYTLGKYFKTTGYRRDRIRDVLNGFPIFWNVRPV